MARVKRLTEITRKKIPRFLNQIAREFLTIEQVNMHRLNSLLWLHRKTPKRFKTYGLQGRNSNHSQAEGWRAFSVRSLPNEESPHGRAYSRLYKFKKHSAFNVWENLNKKLFPFAYISRVMNGLLLLCIYGSLSVNLKSRRVRTALKRESKHWKFAVTELKAKCSKYRSRQLKEQRKLCAKASRVKPKANQHTTL
jgi:hypothetical protein